MTLQGERMVDDDGIWLFVSFPLKGVWDDPAGVDISNSERPEIIELVRNKNFWRVGERFEIND